MLVEKHVEKTVIYSYQANQSSDAQVAALFNILMEVAWVHAGKLHWGYDTLQSNQMFWVLSRIRIEINRLPKWRDKIVVETWPAGNDRMFAYREFRLKDEAGQELLRANSAWLVLNLHTHKIISFPAKADLPRHEEASPCQLPKRLRYKAGSEECQFSPIKYSDIDVNKHLNSVRAFERVLDTYADDFQRNHRLKTVEINYLKEGFEGEEIAVEKQDIGEGSYLSTLIRKEQQQNEPLSLYELAWVKIAPDGGSSL